MTPEQEWYPSYYQMTAPDRSRKWPSSWVVDLFERNDRGEVRVADSRTYLLLEESAEQPNKDPGPLYAEVPE